MNNTKLITNGSFISLLLSAIFMAEHKRKFLDITNQILFIKTKNVIKTLKIIQNNSLTELFLVNIFFNKNRFGKNHREETIKEIKSLLSKNILINLLVKDDEEKTNLLNELETSKWLLNNIKITTQDELKAKTSLKKNGKMVLEMISWLEKLEFSTDYLESTTTTNTKKPFLGRLEEKLKKSELKTEFKTIEWLFNLFQNSLMSNNIDKYDISDFLHKFKEPHSRKNRIKGKFSSETLSKYKTELKKANNNLEAEAIFWDLLDNGHNFKAIISASNWLQFERKKSKDIRTRIAIIWFLFYKLNGEIQNTYSALTYLIKMSDKYEKKLEKPIKVMLSKSKKIGSCAVLDLINEKYYFNATKLIMELKKDREISSVVLITNEYKNEYTLKIASKNDLEIPGIKIQDGLIITRIPKEILDQTICEISSITPLTPK